MDESSSKKKSGGFLGLGNFGAWLSAASNATAIRDAADSHSRRLDQIDALFEELKQHVWEAFRQIGDANQRIEQLAQKISELSRSQGVDHEEILGLKREIMFQQGRLSRLGEGISVGDKGLNEVVASLYDERKDSLYVAFEDTFRGSREEIKSRLLPYLEHVKLAGAGSPGNPILDIGCGRGEWLEILSENHLECYGIDLNSMMIEKCESSGLKAIKMDALQHLRGLSNGSLSAITAFHFIEHISFDDLISFLDESLRVLAPGGIIILETPNPETIRVGATTFYYDPTHRNPLPPVPTKFILEHRGFADVRILRLHPVLGERLKGSDEDSELLNQVLFGPQDYALIARRDGDRLENAAAL